MCILNKHKHKAKEWAGFGWDKATDKLVDVACYLYFQPFEDEKIDKISKTIITNTKLYTKNEINLDTLEI